jgi:hypothetical protein
MGQPEQKIMELLPAVLTVSDIDEMLSIQAAFLRQGAPLVQREARHEVDRLLDLRNEINLRGLGLAEVELL